MSPLRPVATLCVVVFFANSLAASGTPTNGVPQGVPDSLVEESQRSETKDPPPDLAVVEEQIISGGWEEIYQMLDGVDLTASPVLRLIQGHATLATNRNNESLCLFLETRNELALHAWEEWTDHLFINQPGPRVSYLRGDALARSGEREAALKLLEQAVQQATGIELALSYNAQGVLLATDRPRLARVSFDEAIQASHGRLADAHANIGFLRIQLQEGVAAARRAFRRARNESRGFQLVEHGLAWLEFVRPMNEEELVGQASFSHDLMAKGCSGTHPAAIRNWTVILSSSPFDTETRQQLAAVLAPGTTFNTDWEPPSTASGSAFNQMGPALTAMQVDPSEPNFKRVQELHARLSESQRNEITPRVEAVMKTSPDAFSLFQGSVEKGLGQTRPGGLWNRLQSVGDGIGDVLMLVGGLAGKKVPVGAAVASMGGLATKQVAARFRDKTATMHQSLNDLHTRYPQDLGGVLASFDVVDSGGWSIRPAYGLCYPEDPSGRQEAHKPRPKDNG